MLLPYSIDFTDQSDKQSFQIQPGQIDTVNTDLALPGKGRVDYGEFYNENLVRLLENFSSPNPPGNPTKGQLWYDSQNQVLKVYNPATSPEWMQLVSTGEVDRFHVPVVPVLPSTNLAAGDLCYLSTDNKLYIYDSINWRAIATQFWCENYLSIDGGQEAFV